MTDPIATRIIAWLDRVFEPLMAAVAAIVTALNFYAAHNFHTIDKHLVFRERILRGFDPGVVVPSQAIPPTFPMWGYGFVLVLTTNKVLLLAIQIAIALGSIWYLLRVLRQHGLITGWRRSLLQILFLACTPWYAYHSIDWSQSLATSFMVLSIALLLSVALSERPSWPTIVVSALLLGFNLNFASDLYLLPLPLALAAWWCRRFTRAAALQLAIWLLVVGLTLGPWMAYSWKAVGAPLVKSSNQGHVLLIALGQDPKQRFGFSYSDDDPLMYRVIRERAGEAVASRFYASCSYEADLVLRPLFVETVKAHPAAYLDLAQWKLRQILSGEIGTYAGEFDAPENLGRLGIGAPWRTLLARYSRDAGHLLQLATTALAPIALWLAVGEGQRAWALLLVPIAYQYTSGSLAGLQPQYLSNVIALQIVVCTAGFARLLAIRERDERDAA